ncbi:MAG: PfkB family carbohydrate kinase [Bacteroidia bacterium]|nr:PfkB family carbohydrate kinase [Bacteroidia bacterium]MDW8333155.1 PfkB family carbohydrate kinase [Bacteroidia bacterium]
MSLLAVGTMAFDEIETPFAKVDKIIGGAATFIALSASYFTRPVYLTSVVGGDFPREVLEDFARRGIDLSGVEIRENQESFFWRGRYHNDLNTRDTLETRLNVLADFNPVLPETYLEPDVAMLGNLTPSVQAAVIAQFRRRPKLVVMDTMDFWMNVAFEQLLETIKLVDVLTINDEEARRLSGEYSLRRAAKKILTMGPRYLVVKKGEHGALLFHGDEVFFAPALPLEEVFDPTGAGDTFAGGFCGYLDAVGDFSFESMKNAVVYGSAMAGFCVEKFGPQRLFELSEKDISRRLQQYLNLSFYRPNISVF